MKVYLVFSSTGSHGDYRRQLRGVWFKPEDAEADKSRIEGEIEIIKNKPIPLGDHQSLQELLNNGNRVELDRYYKWADEQHEAQEFNECTVEEVPTNKRISK